MVQTLDCQYGQVVISIGVEDIIACYDRVPVHLPVYRDWLSALDDLTVQYNLSLFDQIGHVDFIDDRPISFVTVEAGDRTEKICKKQKNPQIHLEFKIRIQFASNSFLF